MASNMQAIKALSREIQKKGSDDPAVVTRACRRGVSANAVEDDGWPLIVTAAYGNKPKQTEELLRRGANVDLQNGKGSSA
eukprot:CAMPEP_0198321648 /NCGR_PEP_ID=MMETSP1450-20131203/10318_1 /TAXON_ID=753684 ORGANISM="Madagascaria erythrocladiodes, Strain CCMP3234" /NCGR_SAMPLE_ID=MMETSP1450 /ASSEMBLY_ACC=CAM_ASM_001115 /LENGTH=79 /DNA_ID=CAMNT_0044025225 /DNA_START=22 /DNA_END=257 /DNA_ORIENTATION=-